MREGGGEKKAGGKIKQTQATSSTPCSEMKMFSSWPSQRSFLDINEPASAEKECLPQSHRHCDKLLPLQIFFSVRVERGRGESNGYFCLASNIQGLIYSIPCSMMVYFNGVLTLKSGIFIWLKMHLILNTPLGTWLWDDYRTDGHQTDSISLSSCVFCCKSRTGCFLVKNNGLCATLGGRCVPAPALWIQDTELLHNYLPVCC